MTNTVLSILHMKRKILFILFLFSIYLVKAQNIAVVESPKITSMVEHHIQLNRLTETVEGWRIQIYATTDRGKLEEARNTFVNRYPYIAVDWVHASPWYRLRAGAFSTKLEATQMLNRLKLYYPDAYLAKDKIKPQDLLKFND